MNKESFVLAKNRAIRGFRTSPFWFTLPTVAVTRLSYDSYSVLTHEPEQAHPLNLDQTSALAENIATYSVAGMVAATGIGIAVYSGSMIKKHFRIREKVAEIADNDRYRERFMEEQTFDHWCTRQAARVALQNTKYLDRYDQQVKDTKIRVLGLKWLPHI